MGLSRAGFDVIGIDIDPQPNYPFTFVKCDALSVPRWYLRKFDLIWASPPCQAHSAATRDKTKHLDLIPQTRAMLQASGVPFVIENVVGAPLINPVTLCGAMFGLGVVRHRLFEAHGFELPQPEHVKHKGSLVTGEYVTVAGNGGVPAWTMKEREKRGLPRHIPGEMELGTWSRAMGIDWMTRRELTQAIPPAFSQYIGAAAIEQIKQARAA